MFECRRCNQEKDASEFREDQRYKRGYASWCKECHRSRNSEWAKENRPRLTEKSAAWRARNLEKARLIDQAHRARNSAEMARKHATWAKANRDKRRATDAKHKAAKRCATPSWADTKAIAAVYRAAVERQRATGLRMHVDHIVPLQSRIVCGLHCEANLQILPGSENESKRNFWWPDMPEAAYRQPRLFDEPVAKPVQASLLEGL